MPTYTDTPAKTCPIRKELLFLRDPDSNDRLCVDFEVIIQYIYIQWAAVCVRYMW